MAKPRNAQDIRDRYEQRIRELESALATIMRMPIREVPNLPIEIRMLLDKDWRGRKEDAA